MTIRALAPVFIALAACFPIAAQSERRITIEASSDAIVAHVEPATEIGSVLLSSAGRVLGQRAINNGRAQWSALDLPPGAYIVQASFKGIRSQPLAYSLAASAVAGFSASEAITNAPKQIKALFAAGRDVNVLSRRGIYAISRMANGHGLITYPVAGALADSATLADFDGDGVADLASAVAGHVEVVLSGQTEHRGAVVVQSVPDPVQLASGDFDGDGVADLAIANTKTGEIRILKGSGNGFLPAIVARAASGGSVHVAVDDLNGDGHSELVVADTTAQEIVVLQFAKDGFIETAKFTAQGIPTGVATGDFSGAGRADIVWLNADGFIRLAGRTEEAGRVEPGSLFMTAADINRDGRMDLVFADQTGVRVAYGAGPAGQNPVAQTTLASTVVNKSGDDGTPGTLRYVVSNATPGSAVTFDSSVGMINLQCNNSLDCTITVPAGVSINGLGINQTFISGAGATRIFRLQGNSRISNLTLENGLAKGGRGADGYAGGGGAAGMGGAVFVQGAGNQFQNVDFQNNSAIGGDGGSSHSSGYPLSGGGGGGIGGNGGQGHHGSSFPPFFTQYDAGGDGGFGGVLGGSGGAGGVEQTVAFGQIAELLTTLASLQFEDLGLELPALIRGLAVGHGVDMLVTKPALDTILNYYGIDPNQDFDTEPTDGGPGAGGGGAPENIPLGMAGGYGGGGGGSAEPLSGYGGRSLFGGGIGGGADTNGPGRGGSGYGGAVFIYQGASADFDGCTFANNHATGGASGLKDGFAVSPNAAAGFGGAVYVDVGGRVTYNPSTGLNILAGNAATFGTFSSGAPWFPNGNPGVAMVIPGGNSYSGQALKDAIQGAPAGTTIRFFSPATVNLSSPITISKSLVIDGQNQVAISGAIPGTTGSRLFLVTQGNVTFKNMTLASGDAEGGVGGFGAFGGGGGAGAGGAIFIHAGNVTLSGVTFSGNIAVGGPGEGLGLSQEGGGGGGSLTVSGQYASAKAGGAGGASFLTGEVSLGAFWSDSPTNCGTSPACIVASAMQQGVYAGGGGSLADSGPGSDGNMFGGGGGAGFCASTGSLSATCGTPGQRSYAGGRGGYGAGGGAGNPGGQGGKFAGAGQSYPSRTGGGGAGMGGAIFLRSGVLTIDSCSFINNSASGDRFNRANSGQGKGGAIFNQAGTIYWQGPSTFQGNTAANAGNSTFDNNDIYGGAKNLGAIPNAPTTNAPGLLPPMTAAASPQAIVARDVNGDFIPDLVVETANSVLVYPGRGDGTFGTPTSTPIAGLHQNGSTYNLPFAGMATGYLNSITTNPAATIVTAQQGGAYLLPGGRGAGYLWNTAPPAGLAIGDLDSDGFDDLALVGPGSRGIDVVLGNPVNGSYFVSPTATLGNDATVPDYAPGQFTTRHRDTVLIFSFVIPSCGTQPFSAVTVGDFDGDGLNDIAAAGPDCVLVAYNQGGGDFNIQSNAGPVLFFGAAPVTSIVPVPTPDGKVSFLVTAGGNTPGRTLTTAIFGRTTLGGQPVFGAVAIGPAGGAATAGDFNRDGNPDLLIAYPATHTAALYLGSSVPNATCMQKEANLFFACLQPAPLATWNLPATPVAAASADFNGDGYADFAVATSDGNVSILMGRAPMNVTVQRTTPTVQGLEQVDYTAIVVDPSNVSTGTMMVALSTSARSGIVSASVVSNK